MQGELTFLALGDSYTIGEGVPFDECWPVQLVRRLEARLPMKFSAPEIVARTGWTTDELQHAVRAADLHPPYNLVSLLIGVNNQYRGYPIAQYQEEFEMLLKQAVSFAGHDAQRVFVVSIPDYGVTPFSLERNMDMQKIASEINHYNDLAQMFAHKYGVRFIEITRLSRNAANQPGLITDDDLHPSGAMYRQWVDLIEPQILPIVK